MAASPTRSGGSWRFLTCWQGPMQSRVDSGAIVGPAPIFDQGLNRAKGSWLLARGIALVFDRVIRQESIWVYDTESDHQDSHRPA